MLDLLLNLTKVIGTIFAGAFGILGLLTEFRDNATKKITKWGRTALFGIICSTLIALVSQVLEAAKAKKDSTIQAAAVQTQLERSTTILRQLARTQSPLRDVRIACSVRLPVESPGLASYMKRIEPILLLVAQEEKTVAQYGKGEHSKQATVSARGTNDIPLEVMIFPDSPLMPQPYDEWVAYWMIHGLKLEVEFFVHPAPVSQLAQSSRADLNLGRFGKLGKLEEDFRLVYDLNAHTLKYEGFTPSSADGWTSNGQIISILDLGGSQMVFNLVESIIVDDPQLSQAIHSTFGAIQLNSLELSVGDRSFTVKSSSPRKAPPFERVLVSDKVTTVKYSFLFPTSIDDLRD